MERKRKKDIGNCEWEVSATLCMLLQCVSLPTGGSSIKEYRIAGNKQQVLTRDSNGEVEVWDVLHVSMICTGPSKQYRFDPELSGKIAHTCTCTCIR